MNLDGYRTKKKYYKDDVESQSPLRGSPPSWKRSPIFHREEDGEVYDIVHMPNTSCPVDDNSNESFSPGDRESSRLRSAVDSSLPRSRGDVRSHLNIKENHEGESGGWSNRHDKEGEMLVNEFGWPSHSLFETERTSEDNASRYERDRRKSLSMGIINYSRSSDLADTVNRRKRKKKKNSPIPVVGTRHSRMHHSRNQRFERSNKFYKVSKLEKNKIFHEAKGKRNRNFRSDEEYCMRNQCRMKSPERTDWQDEGDCSGYLSPGRMSRNFREDYRRHSSLSPGRIDEFGEASHRRNQSPGDRDRFDEVNPRRNQSPVVVRERVDELNSQRNKSSWRDRFDDVRSRRPMRDIFDDVRSRRPTRDRFDDVRSRRPMRDIFDDVRSRRPVREIFDDVKSRSPMRDRFDDLRSRSPMRDIFDDVRSRNPMRDRFDDVRSRRPVREIFDDVKSRSPMRDRFDDLRSRSPMRDIFDDVRSRSPMRDRFDDVRSRRPVREIFDDVQSRSPMRDRFDDLRSRSPMRDIFDDVRSRSPMRDRFDDLRSRSPLRDRFDDVRNRSPMRVRFGDIIYRRNTSPKGIDRCKTRKKEKNNENGKNDTLNKEILKKRETPVRDHRLDEWKDSNNLNPDGNKFDDFVLGNVSQIDQNYMTRQNEQSRNFSQRNFNCLSFDVEKEFYPHDHIKSNREQSPNDSAARKIMDLPIPSPPPPPKLSSSPSPDTFTPTDYSEPLPFKSSTSIGTEMVKQCLDVLNEVQKKREILQRCESKIGELRREKIELIKSPSSFFMSSVKNFNFSNHHSPVKFVQTMALSFNRTEEDIEDKAYIKTPVANAPVENLFNTIEKQITSNLVSKKEQKEIDLNQFSSKTSMSSEYDSYKKLSSSRIFPEACVLENSKGSPLSLPYNQRTSDNALAEPQERMLLPNTGLGWPKNVSKRQPQSSGSNVTSEFFNSIQETELNFQSFPKELNQKNKSKITLNLLRRVEFYPQKSVDDPSYCSEMRRPVFNVETLEKINSNEPLSKSNSTHVSLSDEDDDDVIYVGESKNRSYDTSSSHSMCPPGEPHQVAVTPGPSYVQLSSVSSGNVKPVAPSINNIKFSHPTVARQPQRTSWTAVKNLSCEQSESEKS